MGDEVIGEWGVDEAGGIEFFAGDGGANDCKNSGADDCADAERGERPGAEGLFEAVLGVLRIQNELVNGLTREQLIFAR